LLIPSAKNREPQRIIINLRNYLKCIAILFYAKNPLAHNIILIEFVYLET